jgi:hypothetical protein
LQRISTDQSLSKRRRIKVPRFDNDWPLSSRRLNNRSGRGRGTIKVEIARIPASAIFQIPALNFVFCCPFTNLESVNLISFESTMTTKVKKGSQRLSRRKETLLKNAYEMGILCDINVVLYLHIRKSGRLITYKSINQQCWPPTEEQIVSALEHGEHHTNNAVATHLSDPSGSAASKETHHVPGSSNQPLSI